MSAPKCARCKRPEVEHPWRMTYWAALASLAENPGGPCHRFERKAPLWMRVLNRVHARARL